MFIRLVCWILSQKKITTHDRQLLMKEVLSSIDALPLHAIITINEGKLFIRGTEVDGERAMVLREGADAALHNSALELIHEQVLYQAVSQGVHISQTPEQMNFAKAAIWYSQEEIKLLKILANGSTTELLG